MKNTLTPLVIGLGIALGSGTAQAEYEINSFLTIGAASSNVPGTYLDRIIEGVTFENDSKYGVNLRSEFNENIYGAAQLLATGRDDQFNVEAEWAFISYKINDGFNIRVGKLNLQTFLHSDYKEVGYLYPHVRLPEEVYAFNPTRNFPGVELMHIAKIGASTTLTSQFFIGSAEAIPSPNVRMNGINGYGVNFQLDNKYFTLRAGAITPEVRLTQTNHTINLPTGPVTLPDRVLDEKDRVLLATFGLSWDIANFVGFGEYISSKTEGVTKEVFPDREGAYLTVGYQMGNFLPYVTSAYADSEGTAQTAATAGFMPNPLIIQDSTTLGMRYDVNDFSAVKFEYKHIEPENTVVNSGFNMGYASDEDFTITSLSYDMIF